MTELYSNGKLLLTGEYVVLDGALSLAVPTKFGQSLKIDAINEPKIIWKSFNNDTSVWFKGEFHLDDYGTLKQVNHDDVSNRIIQILNAAKTLNPDFLNSKNGFKIETSLTFPKNWGLGTSSTLINNIANWAQVDAFELLKNTFGGSGYDIACAQNNTPIIYQIQNDSITKQVDFNPDFTDQLYFVYLNKKQNSRDGIASYNANKSNIESVVSEINDITNQVINCKTLDAFEALMTDHENIISKITKQTPVKQLYFEDFNGCVKSLGAWGGDFVLATAKENPVNYFKSKGFKTVLRYKDMVL